MIAGDRALAARDPALPGLGLVLDGEALAAALGVGGVRVTYLRYKPGTSCVAAIESDAGLGAAYAFRRDVPEKPVKARARGGVVLREHAVAVLQLPAERRLLGLRLLLDDAARAEVLEHTVGRMPALWHAGLEVLRYKPERRLVARLNGADGARALLKVYTEAGHLRARRAAELLSGRAGVPRLLAARSRHRLLIFEWCEGRPLDALLADGAGPAGAAAAGRALAALHELPPAGLPAITAAAQAAALHAGAGASAVAGEPEGARARRLAVALERRLLALPTRRCTLHGDFSADQVLASRDDVARADRGGPTSAGEVALTDLDGAGAGDPAADLASFLADLELRAIDGRLPAGEARAAAEALLAAYTGPVDPAALAVHLPAALLRRAVEPFRLRHPEWPELVTAAIARAEELARPRSRPRAQGVLDRIAVVQAGTKTLRLGRAWPGRDGGLLLEYADERGGIVGGRWAAEGDDDAGGTAVGAGRTAGVVLVGPDEDAALPALAAAAAEPGALLVGHRPGRRAVVRRADGSYAKLVRLHKVPDLVAGLERAAALAGGAFAVPAVVDAAPGRVTCTAVPGRTLTELLCRDGEPIVPAARAVGAALRSLHAAPPAGLARHDAAAEAGVLHDWLAALARYAPARAAELATRVERAAGLLAAMEPVPDAPLHRDLHDGQLLLGRDGAVGILDFDTLAAGDPALDLGNLVAHFDWRVRQGLVPAPRAAAAAAGLLDGYGATSALRARLRRFAEATTLRLACVYAFRPRWAAVAESSRAPAITAP